MDAAGVGKINTISQAVFEGMKVKSEEECRNFSDTGPWPGGCKCNVDDDCIISEYLFISDSAVSIHVVVTVLLHTCYYLY